MKRRKCLQPEANADPRIIQPHLTSHAVDLLVGADMAAGHDRHGAPHGERIAPARRGQRPAVLLEGLDIRLAERHIVADEVAEIVVALKTRFKVETTAEVCNATKVRQDAVKAFGGDAVLVLGSASSSNTARLCECAPCRAFRAGTMDEVKSLDLSGVTHLGVTSGASTPEEFLKAAVAWLRGEMV